MELRNSQGLANRQSFRNKPLAESQKKHLTSALHSTCWTSHHLCLLNKAPTETMLVMPKDCQIKFGRSALEVTGLLNQTLKKIFCNSVKKKNQKFF